MSGVFTSNAEKIRFQHFGFFMLRRPLNSITKLEKFHQRLESESFEEELKKEYQCSYLQEGIRLASADLHSNLLRWLQNAPLSGHDELVRAFYKYFVRASTRCTPFGLFAGLAYGEISGETQFKIDPDISPDMKISPDFNWQSKLSTMLFRDSAVRANLHVKPNSSLVNAGGAYRYIERTEGSYFLNTFSEDEILRATLGLVGEGIKYAALIDQLTDLGHARGEVTCFIDDLLNNDLLEFAEQPTVIGRMFPGKVIDGLNDANPMPESLDALQQIQSIFDNPASKLELLDTLRDQMARIDSIGKGDNLLKVDSFFTFEKARLSESFVQSTIDSLRDLSVLDFSAVRQDLESFKETFRFKYDTQEIPLWVALDSELGLGFDGDFGSLDTPDEGQVRHQRDVLTNAVETAGTWWQHYLTSKYLSSVADRTREISLTISDLRAIESLRPKELRGSLASSAYAFGSIIATERADEAHADLQFVLSACQGPSAINMLGRFADGSANLKKQLSSIIAYEQEQNPDVILAELVHTPVGKVANVMSRPTLYDYEIEYMGNASVEKENVILLSDLMVSVHEGQIILRSKKLGKRIIPRLSNMHNHQRGLPVYRFLAALQSQDSSFRIGWDWGILANSNFLPRVRYNHVIISRATWKLQRSDFKLLSATSVATRLAALGVPTQFVIAVGDNELFIDASVKQSVELLTSHMSKHEVVHLREFMEGGHKSLITAGNEKIANEVVIPFRIKQNLTGRKPFAVPRPDRLVVTEQFEPGSEWVYIKLYASEGMLDSLIRNKIARFAAGLVERGVVEKFFFVRYRDMESHLRLRFLRQADSTLEEIISPFRQLLASEIANKFVSRMQLDTYQRELDRYGRDKIERCESYFSEDSLAITSFLEDGEATRTIQERLTFAAAHIMEAFEAAGVFPDELSDICMRARNRLLLELALPLTELSNWRGLTSTLVRHGLRPDSQNMHSTSRTGTLREILEDLEGSKRDNMIIDLIHMSMNRLFKDHQRYYEAVVYHLIYKVNMAKAKCTSPALCCA